MVESVSKEPTKPLQTGCDKVFVEFCEKFCSSSFSDNYFSIIFGVNQTFLKVITTVETST